MAGITTLGFGKGGASFSGRIMDCRLPAIASRKSPAVNTMAHHKFAFRCLGSCRVPTSRMSVYNELEIIIQYNYRGYKNLPSVRMNSYRRSSMLALAALPALTRYRSAQRRIEIGKPIPNNWGDAHTWDDGARKAGYAVDHTPAKYAIMQTDAGKLGHVAFVEEEGPDGSWKVSEMNVKGWNILSDRAFKPSQAKDYNFIH